MASNGCDILFDNLKDSSPSPVTLLTRKMAFASFDSTPKNNLKHFFDDDLPTPLAVEATAERTKKIPKRVLNSKKPRTFGTNLQNKKFVVHDECANLEPPSISQKTSLSSSLARSVSSGSSGFGDDVSDYYTFDGSAVNSKRTISLIPWSDNCSIESSFGDEGIDCSDQFNDTVVAEYVGTGFSEACSPQLSARRLISPSFSSGRSVNDNSETFSFLRRRQEALPDLVRQNSMAAETATGFMHRQHQFGLDNCSFGKNIGRTQQPTVCVSPVTCFPPTRRPILDGTLPCSDQRTTPKRRRPCYVSTGDTPIIPGGVLNAPSESTKRFSSSPMVDITNNRQKKQLNGSASKADLKKSTPRLSLTRCMSAPFPLDEKKVAACINQRDRQRLAGDNQSSTALPVIDCSGDARNMEIHRVSPDTVCDLVRGYYLKSVSDYLVIDCRFPYEFDGGHIKDAINIHTCDQLINRFFRPSERNLNSSRPILNRSNRRKTSVLIFHCEFSSQRAPSLATFLRNVDRSSNFQYYPFLYFPEIYVMHGGYSEFYKLCPELCLPQDYVKMYDERFKQELILHERITKDSKQCCNSRLKSDNHLLSPILFPLVSNETNGSSISEDVENHITS